jgi:hypothetical protein
MADQRDLLDRGGSASMRVGVASHGAIGHIYPLLGFADVLLAAGHEVIILTGSDLVPWLTDLGYAAEGVGETIGWGWLRFSRDTRN